MKSKLVCCVFVLALLLLSAFALADAHMVENEHLSLTIDTATLDMTIIDKHTGKTLSSGVDAAGTGANKSWTGFLASTLVIDVADGTAVTTKNYDIHSSAASIAFTPLENGADAIVDFQDVCQKVKVQIRLENDSVAVTVPKDGVEEYGETTLCGLYLAPAMGATYLNETEGYLFVPEAAGAIINFSDGNGIGTTPFSKRVYGSNIGVDKEVLTELNRPAEQVTLPVYGLAKTEEGIGYLAVIESGEEASEVMAYPGGVITKYNWAAAHFTLREKYIAQTTRTLGLPRRETSPYLRDMTIRFFVLTDEEATYSGMARKYRAYLEENGAIANADTTYRPRIDFLAAESAEMLIWNSVEVMTTLEQAKEILSDYMDDGLTPPVVLYRGWQPGGLSYALGSGDVSIERALGDEDDLIALSKAVREKGGRFFMEIDPVKANTDRMYNMRVDIVRTIGQTIAEYQTGKDLFKTLYYLTPNRSDEILRAAQEAMGEHVDGLALTTLPNALYSYYSNGRNHMRGETHEAYLGSMEKMSGMLALENPLAGYFAQSDIYLDMPLSTTSYSFLSAEVPFLPMVLSGHVPYYSTWLNFESNQQKALIKMVEYGAYPSHIVTGEDVQALINTNSSDIFTAKYSVMKESILDIDSTLRALHDEIGSSLMINHEIPARDVAVVTYENGAKVIVNYRRSAYEYEGNTIDGQSWLVVKGGAK
ncbi:MAG: hypothetical protein E7322_03465 [Clostridiales bacterium]|nr:hypothetical protein [Clostridiales bacterium]